MTNPVFATNKNFIVDEEFLKANPDIFFVYGDNLLRVGFGGAARLRKFPNSYGFITKKAPSHNASASYTVDEYVSVFHEECAKLRNMILENPNKLFYISRLGAGLANQNGIFEKVIQPSIKSELNFPNVVFLF